MTVLFAAFDPAPFASASIAQVHLARLHTGEDVVMKVQKDGIESRAEADLSMLADLATLADRHLHDLKLYHPVEVVREFARMMRAELDSLRELRNIQDITALLDEYAGESIGSVNAGALVNSLVAVIHEHRLFLPAGVMLLLRMLGELEGTAKRLNPTFGLFELIRPYAREAVHRRLAPGRVWLDVQRGARAWGRLLRALPGDLNDMLVSMRAGALSVHVDHRRLDPVVTRLVLGLLTASLLLGSSLLWSLQAEPVVGGVSLFGAIGYAVACLMGLSLLHIRTSHFPSGGKSAERRRTPVSQLTV